MGGEEASIRIYLDVFQTDGISGNANEMGNDLSSPIDFLCFAIYSWLFFCYHLPRARQTRCSSHSVTSSSYRSCILLLNPDFNVKLKSLNQR